MKGRKRNKDGTLRNNNKAAVVGLSLRARWVEDEVLRIKLKTGFAFTVIAEHITKVGRGQEQPSVPLPEGLTFPKDYSVTGQHCGVALTAALARLPKVSAEEWRDVDTERLEQLYGAAINVNDITEARGALRDKSKLLGYQAPTKIEATGKDGGALTIEGVDALLARVRAKREGKDE